jgi:hypothetical protein
MWTSEVERLDKGGEAVGVVMRSEGLGRVRGAAASRRVPGDDRELIRESIKLPAPRATVEAKPAVQEDKGRTLPGALVGNTPAIDKDGLDFAPSR